MTEKNDLGIGYSNKNKEWRLAFNMKDPYKLTFLKISPKVEGWTIEIERDDGNAIVIIIIIIVAVVVIIGLLVGWILIKKKK